VGERFRYDKVTGELYKVRGDDAPAAARGPYVIADGMPDTFHPATGRHHDSKSAFRRDTKASGCLELGNDAPRESRPNLAPVERAGDTIRRTLSERGGWR
jgi:hypothetical protein